ncbi:MAG: prepilin-type N-terminal cleavage/methylation domain-containing protein [Actinomycetota bacterium]
MRFSDSRTDARGFSLLELILVLALAGLIMGVVAVSVGRTSPRTVGREVVDFLAIARVEAMRETREITVSIEQDGQTLVARRPGIERSWSLPGAVLQADVAAGALDLAAPTAPTEMTVLSADFLPDGRTDARLWEFNEADGGSRIFSIEFDPVSGAPRLVVERDD